MAFRRLERMFGKPHPELEGYKPVAPHLAWLQSAFFRLHRRRQHSERGLQPISHADMTRFARDVLQLSERVWPVFVRVIEETDNAVLHDFYEKQAAGN